ncbi:ribosome maturation factor RimP [[Mycobacterium] wendilense]|uniref:Ribosome maturation factor RimP n=1 Tax=[Mycobacterium] wendilense TaxID=3064284 RepID=A0ABM9MFE9_9MYCO|nr:ribosome maturation factor RimP [Mycolicibacterium sp. MU0050]CAJ1583878.1 ribosome maturation factor RimP [Mycolicibacterium sp. MU0050]
MTQRTGSTGGLPAPSQVIELLAAEFERAGYEIEDVVVDTSARPAKIVVVADGDRALDLDTLAELSRAASQLLDEVPEVSAPYVLEVTSPGVDRPLTAPKHFRRAHGRKVELALADGTTVLGRVAAVDDGILTVVVRERSDFSRRQIRLDDIAKAVVQVDFSSPSKRELELVGQTGGGAV